MGIVKKVGVRVGIEGVGELGGLYVQRECLGGQGPAKNLEHFQRISQKLSSFLSHNFLQTFNTYEI